MIPAECDYYRAESVGEALDLLDAHADRDPELVAGGQGIVPDMKIGEASPGVLVDIEGIERLRTIERDGDGITVGALARHADVASAPPLRADVRALAEAAENVGDVQIRNRGTLGGNLAEADPAADLPAAVLAVDATLAVQGRGGERSVDAADFFRGDGETALDPGEIITHVRVPRTAKTGQVHGGDEDRRTGSGRRAGAYAKKTHPASGYAMVGVAAEVAVEDGVVTEVRIGANGVAERATRLTAVEEALAGTRADDEAAVAAAADEAPAALDPGRLVEDVYASGEFRAQLLATYARRALASALERATDGRDAGTTAGRATGGGGR